MLILHVDTGSIHSSGLACFHFLSILSAITQPLLRVCLLHTYLLLFESFSQEQIYLCPRSGAVAVTLEWAIGSIGFITQPGHLGGGTNQGAQLWS